MRYFVVEVYSDNDITNHEIYIELSGRFGNMIAGVKEVQVEEIQTLRTQTAEQVEAAKVQAEGLRS